MAIYFPISALKKYQQGLILDKKEKKTYVVERPSFSFALDVPPVIVCDEAPMLDFLRIFVEDVSFSAPSAILFLLIGFLESLDFD